MIEVTENDDKTFTISWDENDPTESIFNDWTAEDFIKLISEYAEKTLAESEYINKQKFFIDQTAEEIQQDIDNAEKFLNFNSKNVQESNYEGFNQGPEDYKLS